MGFVQHVSGPTHYHSHTLDLVLSQGINVVDLNVFPHNPGLSDHHFIMFAITVSISMFFFKFMRIVRMVSTCHVASNTVD